MLRVKEAVLFAKRNGKKVTMKSLSLKLWENKNPHTLTNNMHNLANNKTDRVKVEWVKIICEETGFTPNQLFGYDQNTGFQD